MIKLAIIGMVLLAGGIIFSNELTELFPKSVSSTDSMEHNLSDIKDSTINTIDTTVNSGIADVNTKIGEFAENSSLFVKQNIEERIPEIQTPKIFADAEQNSVNP